MVFFQTPALFRLFDLSKLALIDYLYNAPPREFGEARVGEPQEDKTGRDSPQTRIVVAPLLKKHLYIPPRLNCSDTGVWGILEKTIYAIPT